MLIDFSCDLFEKKKKNFSVPFCHIYPSIFANAFKFISLFFSTISSSFLLFSPLSFLRTLNLNITALFLHFYVCVFQNSEEFRCEASWNSSTSRLPCNSIGLQLHQSAVISIAIRFLQGGVTSIIPKQFWLQCFYKTHKEKYTSITE